MAYKTAVSASFVLAIVTALLAANHWGSLVSGRFASEPALSASAGQVDQTIDVQSDNVVHVATEPAAAAVATSVDDATYAPAIGDDDEDDDASSFDDDEDDDAGSFDDDEDDGGDELNDDDDYESEDD